MAAAPRVAGVGIGRARENSASRAQLDLFWLATIGQRPPPTAATAPGFDAKLFASTAQGARVDLGGLGTMFDVHRRARFERQLVGKPCHRPFDWFYPLDDLFHGVNRVRHHLAGQLADRRPETAFFVCPYRLDSRRHTVIVDGLVPFAGKPEQAAHPLPIGIVASSMAGRDLVALVVVANDTAGDEE
jgi:hypothetical protein